MVKLRLRRMGKKKQPFYRIVVADSRASRAGKYVEAIGRYNPLVHPAVIEVNETRLFARLKQGVQPTDTVRSLLRRKGLWLKWGLMMRGADELKIATEFEKWQMLQEEKLRREAEKKSRKKLARKKQASEAPAEAAAPAPAPEPSETPGS